MSTSLVASSTRLPTEAVTSPSRGQPTLVKTGGLPPCRGRSCPDSAGGSLPPGCGVLPLVALGTSPQQGRRRQVAVVPAADPLPGRPGRSRPDFQGCAGCLQDDPSGVVHGIVIATPRLRQPREVTNLHADQTWSDRRGFATTMPLRGAELREGVVNACPPHVGRAIRRSVLAGRQAGGRCHPTAPRPPRS
jgi:hypothetical protein